MKRVITMTCVLWLMASTAIFAQTRAQAQIYGEGTANRISKFTGQYTIGNSCIYESSNKIGIYTPSLPKERFQIGEMMVFHDGGIKTFGYNYYWDAAAGKCKVINYGAPCASSAMEYNSDGEIIFSTEAWGSNPPNGLEGFQFTAEMIIKDNGIVGINTLYPRANLHVDGTALIGGSGVNIPAGNTYGLIVEKHILTSGVKIAAINSANWSDYVFHDGYNLMTLTDLENFIRENKHLPDVPSALDIEKDGLDVAGMDALLLRKIEELTLYMLELKKENEQLKQMILSQE